MIFHNSNYSWIKNILILPKKSLINNIHLNSPILIKAKICAKLNEYIAVMFAIVPNTINGATKGAINVFVRGADREIL